MYCPNCGDERASEVRFCPRCGLRLDGVTELLANNGALPVSAPAQTSEPSRKGMRQGAKLMFLSGVLLPIFFGLCFLSDNPAPLLVPLTVFLAGLSRTLYAKLFYDDDAPSTQFPKLAAPRQSSDSQRADTTNRLTQLSTAQAREASPRRKGMKQGAKLMFLSGVLLPIFFGLCFPADNPAPLLVPLTVFMAGLCWTLYHRLFSEDTAPIAAPAPAPPQMISPYRPPMRNLEARSLDAPPPNAADALHPPSVLEHTTRNLESVPRTPQRQNPQH